MNHQIKVTMKAHEPGMPKTFDLLNLEKAKEVLHYHQSFPQYNVTPLAILDCLAKSLGLKNICVKDESYRFGLNAFKVLGGSYAIGRIIGQRFELRQNQLDYFSLKALGQSEDGSQGAKEPITFVTATDGNHGRGIAWTASVLGQKSVVYMPRGSSLERLENIRQAGAEADITDLSYDDAVRYAKKMADENGWILAQDTAWEGYEEIPTWVMQGYMTMAYEAYTQSLSSWKAPTHLFLQAGVGSMAAAVAGFLAQQYGDKRPMIIIVEPDKANCLYRTALSNDGKLHAVTENMDTIMAGLACGEPSTIAWEILDEFADVFISCPDKISAKGMRILGNPAGSDVRVISGESGAVGVGLVAEIMTNPDQRALKERLNLGKDSSVLFFSTEGDTDREGYRSIVWDGKYPTY